MNTFTVLESEHETIKKGDRFKLYPNHPLSVLGIFLVLIWTAYSFLRKDFHYLGYGIKGFQKIIIFDICQLIVFFLIAIAFFLYRQKRVKLPNDKKMNLKRLNIEVLSEEKDNPTYTITLDNAKIIIEPDTNIAHGLIHANRKKKSQK